MANKKDNTVKSESQDDIAKKREDNPIQTLMRMILKDIIDGNLKIN